MFRRVLPIVRKEFIQILRDPRTLVMVLLLPPVQVMLLGYAVNTDVKHIPTVVADQAQDVHSRGLVSSLTSTEYFEVVGYVDGPGEARASIDRGEAKAGLVIPPDFSTRMLSQRTGDVQMLIDGSDPNVAQTGLFAANAIIQVGAAQQLGAMASRAGLSLPPATIELRPTVLYNPDLRSVNFMIPGLIGLVLQFQSLVLTAFAIVRERERGTLEQLIVSPVRPWELMLGKIAPFVLISFWNVGIATAFGLLWFKVEFNGSFVLLLTLSLLFLLGSLGLGLLVSTVSRTQTQALQMSMFILMPAIMLSGMIFPIENMPTLLRLVSYCVPLTYFLRILRGIALKGIGVEYLWNEVALLAVFGTVVFLLSANRFRKTLT
ncbi:MAG: ABC transporter permease [Dehalococcoidales bacterium]|nr:ABC transporter permease [Dehalococcoidales bacterium]